MMGRAIRWALPMVVAAVALAFPAGALAAGAPTVEGETVFLGGPQEARIEAQIQAGAAEAQCSVQYVTQAAYRASGWAGAQDAACEHAIAAESGLQTRWVRLTGLTIDTSYRYRVLAGGVQGPARGFSTWGVEAFSMEALNEKREPLTLAGGHPYELLTRIAFNATYPENPSVKPFGPLVDDGVVRDVELELPAGLVGAPSATPQLCSLTGVEHKTCPPGSQIGTIEVDEEGGITRGAGLFNMTAPRGVAARFGARINLVANAIIEAHVRSGGDYGIDADSLRITGAGAVTGVIVHMWGVPAAESHTPERYCGPEAPGQKESEGVCPGGGPPPVVEGPETPFLTLPSSCTGPSSTQLAVDSYQAIGIYANAFDPMPVLTGCAQLRFAPEIETTPTAASTDSPTGMNVNLRVPQNEEPAGTATSDLKAASVTFPAGVAVDPSSAGGLQGCTPEEVGLEMSESERQRIEVEPRTEESFRLSYEGAQTPSLPASVSASEVQAALEALPGIGASNMKVSGGSGGAFDVQFTGTLAHRRVAPITATATAVNVQRVHLEGPSAAELASQGLELLHLNNPEDSFNVAVNGHSTAATLEATAHLSTVNSESKEIGYIEDSAITSSTGGPVTGETLTGPGLPPEGTLVRVTRGKIELLAPQFKNLSYTPGEYEGTYEFSLPDTAFAETIQEALEELPGLANVSVSGRPLGSYAEGGAYESPHIENTYTIVYELKSDAAQEMQVTKAAEEVPVTITSSYEAPGTRAIPVTVTQEGGVPHMDKEPAKCPAASKIASVSVKTPLLGHELPGALYLATPHDNPFHSLIALYLAVYDPISGVVIKLPGSVSLNKETGQITTSFENSPQLPFSELKVEVFGANEAAAKSRAPLTTPETCGHYAATSELTPWDGNPAAKPESTHPFQITSLLSGGACPASEAQAPNAPGLQAGTLSPIAGTFSPFVLKMTREDGSQRFGALNVTLPPGMLGKVAGVQQCSQAEIEAAEHLTAEGDGAVELAQPSCPSGSRLGVVHVGAGSGAPFFVTGQVYFAGPYKGAPFSLVIVTPAVAGPFDLGTVVVRAALFIDPETAQVTVRSDPFPSILDGIPLDIRSVGVEMTRPDFTLNPTSCNPMEVTGQEISTAGQAAALKDRFQVGGCNGMPFNPTFTAMVQAHHTRKEGAYFKASVEAHPGQANISKVEVQLPKALSVRDETLKQACSEAQFASNPAGCPAGSFVGSATAYTPILNVPLSGPAIFVSHGGKQFPDMDVVLQGEGVTIKLRSGTFVDKAGYTFSKFEGVPDAPISRFELTLPPGPHSALAGNGNLCYRTITKTKRVLLRKHGHLIKRHKHLVHKTKKTRHTVKRLLQMPTLMIGQNGVDVHQKTHLTVTGCGKAHTSGHKHHSKHHKKHKKHRHKGKHKHGKAAGHHHAHKHHGRRG